MLPSILPSAKTLFWRRHWLTASPEAWLPHVLSISRYGMGSQPNQLIQPTASDLPKPVDWGKLGRNPTIILSLTGHGSLPPPLQGAVAAARIYLLVSAVDPEAVNPGPGSCRVVHRGDGGRPWGRDGGIWPLPATEGALWLACLEMFKLEKVVALMHQQWVIFTNKDKLYESDSPKAELFYQL